MSQVGDALSGGGSSASGVTDSTFSDANLGNAIMGGSGDLFGGATGGGGGPSDFNSFNDIVNAFSGGGGSASASPAASITPTPTVSQTGGDPVGAAGGTQSSTTPGQTPTSSNQPQGGGGQQNQQQQSGYAPPSAVDELKALLKQLSGKPTGPTGPTPQAPGAGQAGQQTLANILPTMPTPAETGELPPGGYAVPAGQGGIGSDAAASASQTDDPAAKAAAEGGPAPSGIPIGGGAGNVQEAPSGTPAQPAETADLPTPQPDAALPTTKPGPAPAPAPSRLLQDITGVSTGSPTALVDLAKAIVPMLPMLAGMMGGGGGGRGRRPGFQGMRGFRPFGSPGGFRGGGGFGGGRFDHLHGGNHPAAPGAWPYHHPMHGWHMHPFHPGGGWAPLNPLDAQGIVGGGQQQGQDPNAPDPNRPPKETGATVGPPDQAGTSGAIPGVSGKQVDDYTREAAERYHIDPDVASRVLAQESSYGQARTPGDNGTSFGPFQLHFAPDGKALGDQFLRDTGRDPRDPSTWKDQIDYALQHAASGGWGPWTTTMKKLGMNQWSGITGHQLAGQTPQSKHPTWAMNPNTTGKPDTLPVTSQPMVAGP